MRTGAAKSESEEDSEPSSIEGLVGASPPSSDPPHSLGVGCLGNGMTKVTSLGPKGLMTFMSRIEVMVREGGLHCPLLLGTECEYSLTCSYLHFRIIAI